MDFTRPTQEDLDTVTRQLGRKPARVVGVAARCPAGHPSVVVNYPVHRKEKRLLPFPTLFWLTCPELIRAISRLEMRGLIRELDERLERDDEFATSLWNDHEAYIRERWGLLSPADQTAIETGGMKDVFLERGIGGLGHMRSVKCLHLHFAHHLATSNVIGALLEDDHAVHPCVGPSTD